MKLSEYLPLVHHRFDTALGEDSSFAHLFHGVLVFRLLAVNSPDLSEASLTNAILIHKGGLAHSYKH